MSERPAGHLSSAACLQKAIDLLTKIHSICSELKFLEMLTATLDTYLDDAQMRAGFLVNLRASIVRHQFYLTSLKLGLQTTADQLMSDFVDNYPNGDD